MSAEEFDAALGRIEKIEAHGADLMMFCRLGRACLLDFRSKSARLLL